MSRLSFLLKTAAVVGLLLGVAAVGQRFLLRWAFEAQVAYLRAHGLVGDEALLDESRRHRLVAAIGLPLLFSALGTALIFRSMVRRRALPLAEALSRVAAGSLDVPLPAAPDPEFARVRDAFETMRTSLDRALTSLADTDAQRRRLFSDLAHELATPASVLLALAEAFARPEIDADPATRKALVATLEQEVTRLSRLVRDVGDLADLGEPDVSFEVDDVDLAALARGAVARLRASTGAEMSCEAEEVHLRADAARIDQLLSNLLSNAVRHGGGTPIAVAVRQADGAVVVTVEDGGPGVPDELFARLGERLFRADPSRTRATGGHGLGLAIAVAIVRRHGGELLFGRSALGGLCATARFPSLPHRRADAALSRS